MKAKHWKVSYSTAFIDSTVVESEIQVEARTIMEALEKAQAALRDEHMSDPAVTRWVIWAIGIMEEDVM